jgi:hypothetical protein
MKLSEKNWNALVNIILDPEENNCKKWPAFALVLKDFDWHYTYSDDPLIWNQEEHKYILMKSALRVLEKIDKEKADKMFDEAEREAYES